MNFKNFIKKLLFLIGLLTFVKYLKKSLTFENLKKQFNTIKDIISSFKTYLFNNILTFFPSHLIRILYLKRVMKINIGKQSFIHMGVRFEGNISTGNNSVIGRICVFIGDIIIKDNVSVTAETYVFTSSHIVNDADFNCFYTKVVIEDYAWIGARAMILPGVTIGKGAVLGASAVATKNVPEYSIFAGIPAKQIGIRSRELRYQLNYSPYFQ